MGSNDAHLSPKPVYKEGVSTKTMEKNSGDICVNGSVPTRPDKVERSSNSLIVQPKRFVIPPDIVAEAMSSLHGLDLRWSGPITPTEMRYVEKYVQARYPDHYEGWIIENDNLNLPSTPSDEGSDHDKRKSPRGVRDLSPSFGSNLPDLDKTQLEPSRLLDILTKKSFFPESSISIPEIHARNRVLKHCGLTDDDYLVVFTPGHKEAMMLVGESYPFFRYNYYMTVLEEDIDCIREFAIYKEAKLIPTPASWLNLRIAGSQLSQYFRRKCKHSPKGLFAYPADVRAFATPCIGFQRPTEAPGMFSWMPLDLSLEKTS